jgi:glucose-1-phosphate adenylyltransferase
MMTSSLPQRKLKDDALIDIAMCSHLKKCIVDKNARIGQNVKLINKENVTECDLEDSGIIVKDGIIVVIKDAAIPSGFEF